MSISNFTIINHIISLALEEDIGKQKKDITTHLLLGGKQLKSFGVFKFKEKGILAGIEIAKRVFSLLDDKIIFEQYYDDGAQIKKNEIVARVEGKAATLFKGERTALNFLQRLSGIATLTGKFVEAVAGTKAIIMDTRKTTPGLRSLEKYAVKTGGGINHRMGLYNEILIKNNHIAIVGGITKAVKEIRNKTQKKIEIEVRNLEEVEEAVKNKPDIIMLDNMSKEDIKKSVKIINKCAIIEISGGLKIQNVKEFAHLGVDRISIGALTHSAKAIDIGFYHKGII